MNKLALAGLLAVGCALAAPAAKKKEAQRMEWKGQFCPQSAPATRVATASKQWKELWELVGQPPPPAADFSRFFAAAVFLGQKNSGGYGIAFLEPVEKGGVLTVRYKITKPKGFAIQSLTQPYAVRLYPKTGKTVAIEAAQ